MNNKIRKLNIEDILFFDIECPRKSETLDTSSKEFELFQKKIRNRDTDELPEEKDVIEKYNRKAGLRIAFNKIVCISVAAVKKGKIYTKSYVGDEKEIIENFYKKTQEYKYLCGYNILGYDLPIIQFNSMRHGDLLQYLPEAFNVAGKKQWELKSVIDLMDLVKGTHFYNISLEEVCWHFNIDSPKDGIDGSKVSEVYYKNGVGEIEQYCKRDTISCVHIFNKIQFQSIMTDIVDIDKLPQEKITILKEILQTKRLTEENKKRLKKIKLTKKEIPFAYELISAVLGEKIEDGIW